MQTVVICSQGHRWEVKASGPGPAPQILCPICGRVPEGIADEGTLASMRNSRTSQNLEMATFTNSPPAELPSAPPSSMAGGNDITEIGSDQPALGIPLPNSSAVRRKREASAPAEMAGYQVLDVLGRGGMGVVYKAFQPSLKRVVALKMILEASADEQGLARFRTEAEAVAQLQHPNITQIHEIGEHEGRQFLSLEYVEGGTLAKKLARSLPMLREAAQLMEVLARAMHFAHQRGIIHRDLKPSNVLLTKEGQPKISDFGLAECTPLPSHTSDSDEEGTETPNAAMTQTGDVLGTPQYMAPEQATGLVRQIGPASDVYSLGAILYEMLTGKSPFEGGNAMQALMRVLHEEPVPPTILQPRVPRDLETICLTCLEKKPARRYASAEALAADLIAFLAGDPIQARPTTPLERLGRWAKCRPTTAVLVVVAVVALLAVLIGTWQDSKLAFGGVAVLSMLLAAWWYNARLQLAVRELAHEHHAAEHNVERLHFLLEANRQLMAAPNVDALLSILGETAVRLVAAERATIYMLDASSAELWSRIAMGNDVGEIRTPLGTGISGMVGLTGETIMLADPYKDVRFNPEVDKRTGYRTRNLLTMPVKSANGTIVGVFQLLNKRQGSFGREDVELLTTLAASAAVALENARNINS